MAHTLTKRQLIEDFELVAEHYRLRELGQYEEAKQVARDDLESAMVCFRGLAEEIQEST